MAPPTNTTSPASIATAPTKDANTLTDEPWTWRRILAKRLFPSRAVSPEGWNETYRMLWVTLSLGRHRIHDLKSAF